MAFGLGKLAVLESKLNIYEDLSKEMLTKLERAVGTISENSNKIAIILERHEGRLDEGEKNTNLIIKMFEDLKRENKEQHEKVSKRIDSLEQKINDFAKFRWIAVGIATAATVVITSAEFFGSVLKLPQKDLTDKVSYSRIVEEQPFVNELS